MTINPCYKGNEGYTLIYFTGRGAILISIVHVYNAGFGFDTEMLMLQKFEAGL